MIRIESGEVAKGDAVKPITSGRNTGNFSDDFALIRLYIVGTLGLPVYGDGNWKTAAGCQPLPCPCAESAPLPRLAETGLQLHRVTYTKLTA